MEQSKKGLLNGTIVYFIGNALVGILQLIILRVITGNITSEEYGYYNLIVSIDSLITPFLTLQIGDALFRYSLNNTVERRKSAFTISTIIVAIGVIIFIAVSVCFHLWIFKIRHLFLVIMYVISTNLFTYFQKMVRAIGENVEFVKSNLMKAVIYLVLQISMIYLFHMEVESLFLSMSISALLCILYLVIELKMSIYFSFSSFNYLLLKKMVKFSIPLIPNTVIWWGTSSINSFIISSKLGLGSNGVYTAAGRIAALIATLSSVFNMAWQESAIKEYDVNKNSLFFKDTFDAYLRFILSGTIALIPITKLVMPLLLENDYISAVPYSPILVIAAGVSAIYGFLGQMYAATEKTSGFMLTNLLGVIINITIVYLFISPFGLYAPCIASVLSGSTIMIARYLSFRHVYKGALKISTVISIILMLIALIIYYNCGQTMNAVAAFILLIYAVFCNTSLIKDYYFIIKERIIKH